MCECVSHLFTHINLQAMVSLRHLFGMKNRKSEFFLQNEHFGRCLIQENHMCGTCFKSDHRPSSDRLCRNGALDWCHERQLGDG